MPLRSVEAATRDDAIAAAREQFGLSARVVGVRRVRSGGVLGFFATERYVAEVDPDPTARPPIPVSALRSGERRAVQDAVRESARDSARDAAREWTRGSADDGVASRRAPARNAAAAWAEARVAPARPAPRPADEDPVDEVAGLLAGTPGPVPYAPAPFTRPSRAPEPEPRPAVVSTPVARPAWSELLAGTGAAPAAAAAPPRPVPAPAPAPVAVVEPPAGPSPFTAALARMVGGDREVAQAVEAVLTGPAEERTAGTPGPWPTWPGSGSATQETSVPPLVAHQEEEPVELQDWTPSSPPEVEATPAWEPAPGPVAPGGASREDSIAEVLRAALAEGRSDEALAGLLRKVMDGAPPAVALADEPVPPAVPEPPAVEPVAVEAVDAEPIAVPPIAFPPVAFEPVAFEQVASEQVASEQVAEAAAEPVDVLLVAAEPLPVPEYAADPAWSEPADALAEEPAELFVALPPAPVAVATSLPTRQPLGSDLGWDDPVSSSLWADTVAPVAATARAAEPAVEEPKAVEDLEVPDVVAPAEATEEPAAQEPAAQQPAPQQPAAQEPAAQQPAPQQPAAEEPAVQEPAAQEPAAEEPAVEEAAVQEAVERLEAADQPVVRTPLFARTASDPAPLSLDSTTVMPPLSLLPPLPSSRQRGGRPPVPPSTGRPPAAAARTAPQSPPEPAAPATSRFESLATVTRLPVDVIAEPHAPAPGPSTVLPSEPAVTEPAPTGPVAPTLEPAAPLAPVPVAAAGLLPGTALPRVTAPPAAPLDRPRPTRGVRAPVPPAPAVRPDRAAHPAQPSRRQGTVAHGGIVERLAALGLADDMLDATFTADLDARGTYAALTRMLSGWLPQIPDIPVGAGDVLVVVGPGVETLRAARALAASLRLDPDRVQWATRGDLAGLAPAGSRMTTIETAIDRRHDAVGTGTLTIVAVDAGLRTDAYWTAQMLAIWSPVAVWAVVEATRKPEDLGPWVEGLPRVDALVVQDTDLSADPAAVLHRVALPLGLPVAVVDGVRATPHRWASLLCERLETPTA